jgi:hypothetical protein
MNKEEDEPERMRLLAIWMLGPESIPAELGDGGAVRADGGAVRADGGAGPGRERSPLAPPQTLVYQNDEMGQQVGRNCKRRLELSRRRRSGLNSRETCDVPETGSACWICTGPRR